MKNAFVYTIHKYCRCNRCLDNQGREKYDFKDYLLELFCVFSDNKIEYHTSGLFFFL